MSKTLSNGGTIDEANKSAFFDSMMYLDSNNFSQENNSTINKIINKWGPAEEWTVSKEQRDYRKIVIAAVNTDPSLGEYTIDDKSWAGHFYKSLPAAGQPAIQACTFTSGDGKTSYVAYRGTPDGIWPTDGAEIAGGLSPYQKGDVQYFNDVAAKHTQWGEDGHTVINSRKLF